MSAYSVLTGLYPPEGKQVWNGTLPWQPIPVHTVPRSEDYLLYLHCPTYEKAYEELLQSPPMLKIQNQHKDLIDYISQHSGLSATLGSLLLIMDPLLCEKINKKPYPPWLIVNDTAEIILKLIDLKVQVRTNTPELARIREAECGVKQQIHMWLLILDHLSVSTGPLLGRMIQNMKDHITNKLSRKALLFSAHDSTIEAFLSALNVFNHRYVPYGSSVYVELHEIKDAPVVKVFYRNDTTAEPYLLELSGCSDLCTVAELERLTQHMIPEDSKAMCEGDSHTSHRDHLSGATVAVAVLIPVILAMFLAILAYRFMQERKRQALYRYRPVNEHL
ncbi:testicular acid phosphatase homolog [Haliotis rubra]|uniref:testicular acid phosphatase homolog n=1 Tax=Haliotis rubra TaxID=36100 RepID=UPI001EE60546|nr:testicular acid phosphatase homolog [Haliotis rubra]